MLLENAEERDEEKRKWKENKRLCSFLQLFSHFALDPTLPNFPGVLKIHV